MKRKSQRFDSEFEGKCLKQKHPKIAKAKKKSTKSLKVLGFQKRV